MEYFIKYGPAWFMIITVVIGWGGAAVIAFINGKWRQKILDKEIEGVKLNCRTHIEECGKNRDKDDKRKDDTSRAVCKKIQEMKEAFESYKKDALNKREDYVKSITTISSNILSINARLERHDKQAEARVKELEKMQSFNDNVERILKKMD